MALLKVKGNLERLFDKNLNDLVRGIRNHKDDESKYIASCLEEIKQELRQHNTAVKANAVQKLTYLQMLGYDVSWAGFNVVEVMASTKFTEKRVGYLSASQTFHKDTEVLMLTTNMIRKDLNSQNVHDAGVALSSLSCFMSPDLARDLTGDILTLLTSTKPYIRKKAVLILYKVFLRYPEALRQAFPRLKEKLEDPDPGVQSAAVNVICELARKNPRNYLSLAPTFFKLMTTSQNNWMLIKIIKLFGALTPLEPRLGKKLIEPLTNLIHSTSAMSLLYECINTVIAVLISISSGMPNHTAAIQLCVQKLRILIEDSDQNLKYLGLLAMSQILKTNPKSVQGHKDLVMQCLDDSDESIRLRALDLLYGMVSKKNLMEIVKKLMMHMDKAEGTTYRDELMDKIILICSQNDYQHITNFEWYVTVLVELTRMEGTKHGHLIAGQMMDVAIRVASIRPFAVAQMALLIDNYHLLVHGSGQRNSAAEVLYAASWICGEFSQHLQNPEETLQSMFRAKINLLPGHIQAVYVQNGTKLFGSIAEKLHKEEPDQLKSLASTLESRVEDLVSSADLEVQERASVMLQFIRYVVKHVDKGDDLSDELGVFFAGELNPVAAKAQKKVPVPEGLDLDAWINEPPSESSESEEDDEEENSQGVFVNAKVMSNHSSPKKLVEPTKEELKQSREARLAQQSMDPFYLKDSQRSPARQVTPVDDIPVQTIDLGVPLTIPGLATTDQYMNISRDSSVNGTKKKHKKHKKHKKEVEADQEEPPMVNVFVSRNAEMPEGAKVSDDDDGDRDDRPHDDPHKALGAINLDDIETPAPYVSKGPANDDENIDNIFGNNNNSSSKKEKKAKKVKTQKKDKKEKKDKKGKKKEESEVPEEVEENDINFWLSDQPVAKEKEAKKKHKKHKSKATSPSPPPPSAPSSNGLANMSSSYKVLAENKYLKLTYDVRQVPMDAEKLAVSVNFCNVSPHSVSGMELDFVDTAQVEAVRDSLDNGIKIDMKLCPGQTEEHLFLFKVGHMSSRQTIRGTATFTLEDGQQDKLDMKVAIRCSTTMVPDPDGLSDILAAGVLDSSSSLSKTIQTSFGEALAKLSHEVNFAVVEQVDTTAYLHAKSLKGDHVAFLIKAHGDKNWTIEGKSNNASLLAALTDELRDLSL